VRGHEPERLLAPPRILLFEPLHLPGLPPEQGPLDRLPVEVETGALCEVLSMIDRELVARRQR
jgi:hypothetical protein